MLYDPKYDLDEVSRLILAAADLIEREGWCQHSYTTIDDRTGRVKHCAAGALRACGFSNHVNIVDGKLEVQENWLLPKDIPLVKEAATRICLFLHALSVPQWNDGLKRTKEEVIAAMRGAAYAKVEEGC